MSKFFKWYPQRPPWKKRGKYQEIPSHAKPEGDVYKDVLPAINRIVDELRVGREARNTAENEKKSAEQRTLKALNYAAGGAIVASIVGSVSLVLATCSLNHAKETRDLDFRPWVSVDVEPTGVPVTHFAERAWELDTRVSFRDYGKTPATKVAMGVRLLPHSEMAAITKEIDAICGALTEFRKTGENRSDSIAGSVVEELPPIFPDGATRSILRRVPAFLDKEWSQAVGDRVWFSMIGCLRYESLDGSTVGTTRFAAHLIKAAICDFPPISNPRPELTDALRNFSVMDGFTASEIAEKLKVCALPIGLTNSLQ